jgi:hypothetical protein
MSYELQVTQVNEEPTSESSLDLTLKHHPCDENLESQEVCARFEIDPPRAWYYCILPTLAPQ